MEDEQNQLTSPPPVEASSATAGASAKICSNNSNDSGIASPDGFVHKDGRKRNQHHGRSAATPTRVKTQDLQTKDFNYSRVNSKLRRHQQIDDLDKNLREEQETSRRLRSAVSILEGKLNVAEEGRRRSNGLERAFFSHLTEVEALVLQRDRLMAPGADETRAQCLEAARRAAHQRLANILRRELGRNSSRRSDGAVGPGDRSSSSSTTHRTVIRTPAQEKSVVVNARQQTRSNLDATVNPACDGLEQAGRERHRSPEIPCRRNNHGEHGTDYSYSHAPGEANQTENGVSGSMNGVGYPPPSSLSCWESDAVMHAYRSAAAGAVRRISSALFGQELLAVEAARASAAERERMLQEETRAFLDSQVSLQVEKDQLEGVKASLRAEVHEAKADLKKAKEKNRQQQEKVKDAERVHSSLSWRILSLQVARDELSQAVGERLRVIQTAVCRRVGFLPRTVEGAVNDLVALCSAPGPSDGEFGDGNSTSIEKGLLLAGNAGLSVSTSTSRTSSHKSSSR
ncbi:unnamed protein product [Ectocarpus sp. 4 AP-2014]